MHWILAKYVLIFHWHSLSFSDDITVYLFSYGESVPCLPAVCLHFAKWSICHISWVGNPKNGGCVPEIWIRPRFFYSAHLPTQFRHPMFNCSEVITLTNKQTNKEILSKASTSLCYAMPLENYHLSVQSLIVYISISSFLLFKLFISENSSYFLFFVVSVLVYTKYFLL